MNREQFLKQLRAELRGMAPREIDEIAVDYEEYFRDALADGRDETEVSRSLGTPRQLARELRAEARIKDWQQKRSTGNFARMLIAVAGLGLMNLIMLGPLLAIGCALLAFFLAALALILAGAALVLASLPGAGLGDFITVDVAGSNLTEPLAVALAGIGVFCSGLVLAYVDVWLTKWAGIGLARYVRLNYRVIRGEA
ncbi:DUF1700 domain-containing protein [Chitinimonas koreensis]|uniref:DUF1700 domain-containing protein n=1 Tax=Chitinimonas koreensis TaxID=356302 RepID=UPI00041A2774|nr:DUF1700 domain-containing protein [Chitinimonas koreensis]QNM97904.1 DUF1700 domain-containing protein [Chitinimonas koreensis]